LSIAAPGYSFQKAASEFVSQSFYLNGMISLGKQESFILVSMFFSAVISNVIDRRWRAAAIWCLIAAAASACGIIHGFVFTADGGTAPALFKWTGFGGPTPSGMDFAVGYALAAALLFGMHAWKPKEIEY
jgi:hypothetical protein